MRDELTLICGCALTTDPPNTLLHPCCQEHHGPLLMWAYAVGLHDELVYINEQGHAHVQ